MRPRNSSRRLGFARELRKALTVPEERLWRVLRDRRLAGLKFRRQVPIEKYIADFACVEKRLIVEVDGESHADRAAADHQRTIQLNNAGWRIVRVTNDDVLQSLEGVLMLIIAAAGFDPAKWRDGEYGQLPEGTF